jgi:tetratricopeptide (TPR) repeat protein
MRQYPDDGRFEVLDDPGQVVGERHCLWKWTRLWFDQIAPGLSPKDGYWIAGIERRTGARVQIHPRSGLALWAWDLAIEAVARRVQALALPYTLPVLHVGPGVVFAAPPLVQPRPSLAIEEAAACALQACEATAHLHAQGCGPLVFGPSHLRLVEESGEWQIRWRVPGVVDLDMFEALEVSDDRSREQAHQRWQSDVDPIERDLWQIAFFFFSLLAADAQRGEALDPERGEVLRTLTRIRDEGPSASTIHDAASMAGLFVVLARLPAMRAEALPVVRVLPRLYPDWDMVIAEGEAWLASESERLRRIWLEHIQLPLAVAYHQRASRAWARGDLDAALGDVDRALALDDHAPYHTTRAVLLDALDRRAEALAAISAAFEVDARPREEGWLAMDEDDTPKNVEQARAHLTRGLIALRDGSLEQAESDIRRAEKLDATPLSARALAAVVHARDKKKAAGETSTQAR